MAARFDLVPKITEAPGEIWQQICASPLINRLSKTNKAFLAEAECRGWAEGALVITFPRSCAGPIGRILPTVRDVLVSLTGDQDVELWTIALDDD